MYVIVNKDMGKKIYKRGMTKSYQHVQASHAVASGCLYCSESKTWGNRTLIVLGASQRQFIYYWNKLWSRRNVIAFTEPDLEDEQTAFACILQENEFNIFKRLKLL